MKIYACICKTLFAAMVAVIIFYIMAFYLKMPVNNETLFFCCCILSGACFTGCDGLRAGDGTDDHKRR